MKKTILKVILGTIILEAILICCFILLGNFNEVGWDSLVSVGIILECSIPCLFYAKIYDDPKYKDIAILGAIISGITAIIGLLSLWTGYENDILKKIADTLQSLMWLLVFISQLLSYNSTEKIVNYFKKISICTLIILDIFILVFTWTGKSPENFIEKLFCITIVLTVASYIATLIVVKIYKKNINTNLNDENKKIPDMNENLSDNNTNN